MTDLLRSDRPGGHTFARGALALAAPALLAAQTAPTVAFSGNQQIGGSAVLEYTDQAGNMAAIALATAILDQPVATPFGDLWLTGVIATLGALAIAVILGVRELDRETARRRTLGRMGMGPVESGMTMSSPSASRTAPGIRKRYVALWMSRNRRLRQPSRTVFSFESPARAW